MTSQANPIDVFICRGPDDGTPTVTGLASPDVVRVDRLRTPRRRRQLAFRRAKLRWLLRSRLRMVGHGVVHHSTSMSGNLAAVALGAVPLGVDVEREASRIDFPAIVSFLQNPSGTQTGTDCGPFPQSALRYDALMAWTRLEAGIKLRGSSLHAVLRGTQEPRQQTDVSTVVFATGEFACAVAFWSSDHLPAIHLLSAQEVSCHDQ
jgi:hypothetical protein